MVDKRICREAVTTQCREGGICMQHGARPHAVCAEHEPIAQQGAVLNEASQESIDAALTHGWIETGCFFAKSMYVY